MEGRSDMALTVTPHSTDDFWSKEENVDEYLARKLRCGSTSLVLGAGASNGFNLPDWAGLVKAVRDQCGAPAPTTPLRPEQEADILLQNNFSGDRVAFAKAVREGLYLPARHDKAFLLKSDLLQAITAFLSNSLRGKGGAVVTFNFDDILETYLRLLGFVVRSETSVPAWTVNADMLVYHPHGLLPMASEDGLTTIVFTMADFDAVVGRESEVWNKTMDSVWSTTFPVFIGLSGDDPRLRSVLDSTKKSHPAATRDQSLYWAVRPTLRSASSHEVHTWKRLGVVPRYLDSHAELPTWLLSICQMAANGI